MIHVRACMKEGKTLILLRSRYIYESLLDAPNGHYIREVRNEAGEEVLYRSMLSLAGETKSMFINPSFRCCAWKTASVMLAKQDKSWTVLTFATALALRRTIPLPPFRSFSFPRTLLEKSLLWSRLATPSTVLITWSIFTPSWPSSRLWLRLPKSPVRSLTKSWRTVICFFWGLLERERPLLDNDLLRCSSILKSFPVIALSTLLLETYSADTWEALATKPWMLSEGLKAAFFLSTKHMHATKAR